MGEQDSYRLAEGVDVVRVGDDAVLFRSDSVTLRLEGASAVQFAERVIPLLDGHHAVDELAQAAGGVAPDDLVLHLESLRQARVLTRAAGTDAAGEDVPALVQALLESLGVASRDAARRLRGLHVVVFGATGHGGWTAEALARVGVGRLTLVDPYPWRAGDGVLSLAACAGRDGEPRQQVVARALAQAGAASRITTFPDRPLQREDVFALAEQADFLLGCFDRAFGAAHQWINRASLQFRKPALYGELRGARVVAGPLVLPEEGPCYLCWKMRAAACEEHFRDAMAYEEYLDQLRAPPVQVRPAFPGAAAYLGSILAMDVLRTALGIAPPALAGRMEEHDLLTGERRGHTVLQRPDCPACRKKPAGPPTLKQVSGLTAGDPAGDLLDHVGALVSARCGVVRTLERVVKDPSEPGVPYIMRAQLANHRFVPDDEDAFIVCSGKGLTPADAQRSALGEAVERYSGSMWTGEDVVLAPRADLEGPSLDPRRLVLYREEQYATLPYARYGDSLELGWLPAWALGAAAPLWVPAIAVYMAYDAHRPHELLFAPTSNGLAAGPTLARAVLSAAFEVVERDAFLVTWLNRLPAERIDPATHPEPAVVDLCRAYARRGVAMELYRLPTDVPCHVFMAVGVAEEDPVGPAAVVGLGADLDAARAARGAILEVGQVRPALRIKLRDPEVARRRDELVEDSTRVARLEDHDLLYASPRTLGSFEFLRSRPVQPFPTEASPSTDPLAMLDVLAAGLKEAGTDLLYCDLTTADMRRLGLHTARALIPDFQPIYFGEQERRLGGERLFELPRTLGLRPGRTRFEQVNPDPHPLA